MKSLVLGFFLFLAGFGIAQACPDLAGEYRFEKTWNGKLLITQLGCESIQIQFIPLHGKTYRATLLTDGQAYEAALDSEHNPSFDVPAPTNSKSFDRASYVDGRFAWRSFEGDRADCEGKYSFDGFECKLFERSFGYDEKAKAYTWKQTGFWRSSNAGYGDDVFLMRKTP